MASLASTENRNVWRRAPARYMRGSAHICHDGHTNRGCLRRGFVLRAASPGKTQPWTTAFGHVPESAGLAQRGAFAGGSKGGGFGPCDGQGDGRSQPFCHGCARADQDGEGTAELALDVAQLLREAILYGQTPVEHLVRLLAHGLAHVCGLDHGEHMWRCQEEIESAGKVFLSGLRAAG